MKIFSHATRHSWLRIEHFMRLYPPFVFVGAKVEASDDYRMIRLMIPNRWYIRNQTGLLFGGVMAMISDPFPSLMYEKFFEGAVAFTKSHAIEFLRPSRTDVVADIVVTDEALESMREQLWSSGKGEVVTEYFFRDTAGVEVAKVITTTFLKRKVEKPAEKSETAIESDTTTTSASVTEKR